MDTTNQTALITGAGNGIGRAIAIAMGENQRNVVCADIDLDAAQITTNTIRQLGVEATAVRVDVGIEYIASTRKAYFSAYKARLNK